MADGLLEAVRGLRLAHPELGPKLLLAKLREHQPDLAAGNKEVREALTVLKAESGATEAAAAAPPAAAAPLAAAAPPAMGWSGTPPPASLPPSLACFGCGRLPSEMGDGRVKHDVCPICVKLKVPTTYWCCVNCPGNPEAWRRHAPYHKKVRRQRNMLEDGGVAHQQRAREIAEEAARLATPSGDAYLELLTDGLRYLSQQDTRRAARANREAIALRPDVPHAYYNLGIALNNSEHIVEAAQRFLEAKERYPVGSQMWAQAMAWAFSLLTQEECAEVAKPEWWNDEGLKALSVRVVRAAPDDMDSRQMRALVLCGPGAAWEVGPRSAAELKEAATHYERAAALESAPAGKADLAGRADRCRLAAFVLAIKIR